MEQELENEDVNKNHQAADQVPRDVHGIFLPMARTRPRVKPPKLFRAGIEYELIGNGKEGEYTGRPGKRSTEKAGIMPRKLGIGALGVIDVYPFLFPERRPGS